MRLTTISLLSLISLAAADWTVSSYTGSGCTGDNNFSEGAAGVTDCVTLPTDERSVDVVAPAAGLQMYFYATYDCTDSPTYGSTDGAFAGCLDDSLHSFKVVNAW